MLSGSLVMSHWTQALKVEEDLVTQDHGSQIVSMRWLKMTGQTTDAFTKQQQWLA